MGGFGRWTVAVLLATVTLVAAGCAADDTEGAATAVAGDNESTDDTTESDGDPSTEDDDGSTSDGDSDADGSGDDEVDETTVPEDPDGDSDGSTTVTENTTTTTEDDGSTTTAGEPDTDQSLVLSPEGFILVAEPSGSTTFVNFGDDKTFALTGLTNTLGPPDEEFDGNAECGSDQASVAVWADEIVVDFDSNDQLLGWSLRPGSSLSDLTGVGLGTAVGDVTEFDLDVQESSLGYEFSTAPAGPAFFGLVTGPDASATITDMWAGTVCIFR